MKAIFNTEVNFKHPKLDFFFLQGWNGNYYAPLLFPKQNPNFVKESQKFLWRKNKLSIVWKQSLYDVSDWKGVDASVILIWDRIIC